MKKLVVSVLALLSMASFAMGIGFQLPASTNATAGTEVVIPVSANSQGALQGVNLYLEVGAPLEITAVSFDAGTIWAGNHNPPSPYDLMGNLAAASTTTGTGTVATPGVVALVTVKVPVGVSGPFMIRTEIPDYSVVSEFVGTGVATTGQGSGMINVVVPEPATALLLVGVLPLIRRRKA